MTGYRWLHAQMSQAEERPFGKEGAIMLSIRGMSESDFDVIAALKQAMEVLFEGTV